ncbi:hypothetical protein [Streptomyces rishiriensis]|uniref:hypothetical protein n=1 Tax=Streptomyces rishiriensis TaxID=68264 RepID=UPI00131F2AEF|nr:hypothetical protein [Streptomyces rishiriensis]
MIAILATTGGTPSPSEGVSAPTATIISAVIAFVTAGIVSLVTNALTHKRERNAYRRELNLKRLNELYGPVKLLLDQNKVLSAQLKEGRPEAWHILDHVNEIRGDVDDKAIVDQILAIDKKIANILEEKSGLCLIPIPDSFSKFLGHYSMLSRAFAGQSIVRNSSYEYFPKQFEADVLGGYNLLAAKLKKESGE